MKPVVIHNDAQPAIDYWLWKLTFKVVFVAAFIVFVIVALLFVLRGAVG